MQSIDLGIEVETECLGGGRLEIDKDNKSIFVYGYSQGKILRIKYILI